MTKQVLARNTISGQISLVPENYLTHSWFKNQLEEVDENAKPLHPILHAEADADGKDASGKQVRTKGQPDTDATEVQKTPSEA